MYQTKITPATRYVILAKTRVKLTRRNYKLAENPIVHKAARQLADDILVDAQPEDIREILNLMRDELIPYHVNI